MRHRVLGKKLGRDNKERKSLLMNLATSLFLNGKIETTTAKAKFVKPYAEKLITKAKNTTGFNTVKYLKTKLTTDEAIRKLLTSIAPTFLTRNGGYLRLVKTGFRAGDNAEISRIEIVKEEKKPVTKKTPAKKAKPVAEVVEETTTESK
jgi:large subunit ribosomal protein L17